QKFARSARVRQHRVAAPPCVVPFRREAVTTEVVSVVCNSDTPATRSRVGLSRHADEIDCRLGQMAGFLEGLFTSPRETRCRFFLADRRFGPSVPRQGAPRRRLTSAMACGLERVGSSFEGSKDLADP